MNLTPRALAAIALLLAGCQAPSQPAPSATPSGTPASPALSTATAGLPIAHLDASWTFGAITAIDQQTNVSQVIYEVGLDDPNKMTFGLADTHVVTVGQWRYAIAPDDWDALAKLATGATVNLYPSKLAAIFKNPDGSTTSTRLMDVYPGSRAEPPLIVTSVRSTPST